MALTRELEYFTYADVLEWDEDVRAEIIDGELFMMAEPTPNHQRLLGALHLQFGNFLKGKKCEVFLSPFGVRFYPKPDNSDGTVFEPDLVVVCDKNKITKRGCEGAPDLIIEILSPSNSSYDRVVKFNEYRAAGVREYWIVDPQEVNVEVFILKDGRYYAESYSRNQKIKVGVLPGCVIDLRDVFEERFFPVEKESKRPAKDKAVKGAA